MTLYGALIWVDALTTQNRALLRKPQRVIAVRAIRGYRTVSWTAATVLAGDPPWELQAEVLAEVFCFRAEGSERGDRPGSQTSYRKSRGERSAGGTNLRARHPRVFIRKATPTPRQCTDDTRTRYTIIVFRIPHRRD
ncbi:uncharacterized protein LOC126770397 [Nymphalis io]|uniref:uncharacterized protein LOC126770397 n=1 Tax=Inachis io TaxID=171585 RepID=UPI0021682126|nr:uncharacterized protein LOC126770397 [Nymphalis io]